MAENRPGKRWKSLWRRATARRARRAAEGQSFWRPLRYEWLEQRRLLALSSTTPTTTFTGSLNAPSDIAIDGNGNLYVSNYQSGSGTTVVKFAPGTTGPIGVLTGLSGPSAEIFDASGNLYVANEGPFNGTTVSKFAPGSTAPTATLTGLDGPDAMAFDASGNLYVANRTANTISKFAPGAITPSATLTGVTTPASLAFDSSGDLFVADDSVGSTVTEFAPGGIVPFATLTNAGPFPVAVAVDSSNNLYVVDNLGNVTKYASGTTTPGATLTGLSFPDAETFDASGDLYVLNAPAGQGSVSEFGPGAVTSSNTLTGLSSPSALAFDAHGDLFVVNSFANTVSEYSALATAPVLTTTNTPLTYTVPSGPVAVDPGIMVSDGESLTIASANISISSGFNSATDRLAFANQNGIVGVYDVASGTLNLSGIASVANYQTALQSITFSSTDTATPVRAVSFTVNDGSLSSAIAVRTIELVTITPSQLVISKEPPSVVTLGGSFSFAVEVENSQDVVSASYNGSITVALANNPTGATLSGNLTLIPVNGVAVFTGLSLNDLGENYTLQVTSGTLTSATTSAIAIVPGPVIKTSPGVLTYSVATGQKAIDPGLTLTDPESSTINSATVTFASGYTNPEDVLVFLSQNGISGNFNPATGAMVLSGTATFGQYQTALESVAYIDTNNNPSFAPRSVTFTAFDGTVSNSPSSRTIDVVAGTGAQIVIQSEPPATVTAGSAFNMIGQVEDVFGNLATTFSGSVSAAIASNPAKGTLSGATSVVVSGGQAVFSDLILNNVGSGYTIKLSSGKLTTATSTGINVIAGQATELAFLSQPPSSVTAGAGFGFTVAAEDAEGNVVTNYTGSATVGLLHNPGGSTLSGTRFLAISNGLAIFSGLSLDKTGANYTLGATGTTLNGATSGAFSVLPNTATQLVVTTQPATVTAGAAFGFTVAAEDAFGNIVTGYSGLAGVSLATNPGSSTLGGSASANINSGVAVFSNLTLNKVATGYTIQSTSAGLTSTTSAAFAVVPGTATQLVITSTTPVNVTAGAGFNITVDALDAQGNLATGFDDNATAAIASGFNLGGSTLSGTTVAGSAGGVLVFKGLSLDQPGTDYELSLTGTGLTPATFGPFNVTPKGEAIELAVGTQPPATVTSGLPFSVTVDAVDGFGSLDTSYEGNVTLSLATNPGSSTLGGTVTVAANNGIAIFSGLTVNIAAAGYTLQAIDGSDMLLPITTNKFTVIPGAATQLALSNEPASTEPFGTGFNLTVDAEDAQGNVATSFNGVVSAALLSNPGSATLGGTTSLSAGAGVAVFSGLSLNAVGNGYTIQMTSSGLSPVTTTAFNVATATLTIAGSTGDNLTIKFIDSTDFTETLNGVTSPVYSVLSYNKVVYNAPTGVYTNVTFQDNNTSDQYDATQSLTSTVLTRSDGVNFEFDANSVAALYVYTSGMSSKATVNVAGGTGGNYYVDATNAGYSYIADPLAGIYSELSGFDTQTVQGTGGSTYAYVYSTSHAIAVGDPSGSTITAGGITTQLSNFPQLYFVGSSDGTDTITLHTAGGGLVSSPSFTYVAGNYSGGTFFIGALYCATVTTFAASPTDTAFFYSYSGDTYNGNSSSSLLQGGATSFASYLNFTSQVFGSQAVTVEESGSGVDSANVTLPNSAIFTSTPTYSNVVAGGVTIITIDTFFINTSGAILAVANRINAVGNATDTADLDDGPGSNTLAALGTMATLDTAFGIVAAKQFGTVNAYDLSGTTDKVSESAVDFALNLVGDWTSS